MNHREQLVSQVREEYANIAAHQAQQHFHQTTTGITPHAYYQTLQNAVIEQILKGKFDNCRTGSEIIGKIAADKTLLPNL